MSALQESRRELMVQLEGLMNLLKVSSYFILFFRWKILSSPLETGCKFSPNFTPFG